jgi:hypothetical protein
MNIDENGDFPFCDLFFSWEKQPHFGTMSPVNYAVLMVTLHDAGLLKFTERYSNLLDEVTLKFAKEAKND